MRIFTVFVLLCALGCSKKDDTLSDLKYIQTIVAAEEVCHAVMRGEMDAEDALRPCERAWAIATDDDFEHLKNLYVKAKRAEGEPIFRRLREANERHVRRLETIEP